MPRSTPRKKSPRRKLAASPTLSPTLRLARDHVRGRTPAGTLAARAAAVPPPPPRPNWLDRCRAIDPKLTAELIAMATDFANGGQWRYKLVTAKRFYDHVLLPEFGAVCTYQTFRVWIVSLARGDA